MYAHIAVNRPLYQTFDYHIPPELAGKIQPGHMVEVSFGPALATGVVTELSENTEIAQTKPVRRRIDPKPVLTPQQIQLAWWMSEHTLTPIGQCIWLMLPPGLPQQSETVHHLVDEDDPGNTFVQKRILSLLKNRGDLNSNQIRRALPRMNWQSALTQLQRRGVIESETFLRPPQVRPKTVRSVRLAISERMIEFAAANMGRETKRGTVLEILRAHPTHEMPVEDVMELAECKASPIKALIEAELITQHEDQLRLAVPVSEVTGHIIDLRQSEKYLAVLRYLARFPKRDVPAMEVYEATGAGHSHLTKLSEEGFIISGEREIWRDPEIDAGYITLPPMLTTSQQAIWDVISSQLMADDSMQTFLLHGVTGSGKTEIYMRAVAQVMAQGRQALVLVPEIALTTQLSQRFAARFPDQVSIIHSGLSPGERYDVWRRAREGEIPIILGARSALFTPLPDIGLIILDEEHDDSFKQSPPILPPYYHARDVAIAYMEIQQGTVIMGSATPDVTSMYRAEMGEFKLLDLPNRVLAHREAIVKQTKLLNLPRARYEPAENTDAMSAGLPPVDIVDMRQELRTGNRSIFSRLLTERLEQVLAKEEQALLFLNRRGTATFVMCRNCGHIERCPNCDMPLTYHAAHSALICHYCGHRAANPSQCPVCESKRIRYFGSGTEQIDQLLNDMFPEARVLRWDQDTASEKGAHERILSAFMARQADILVGTQMIAKGLDIPLVTLVGVISADTALGLPDFRTGERTFQLLTQVAGRAGRGLLKGRVIFQTYQPDHYAIKSAAKHDYFAFYEKEIAFRRAQQYPPYMTLARLEFRDKALDEAQREAAHIAELLRVEAKSANATEIVGPTPSFFARVDGLFRWQVIVRSPDVVRFLQSVDLPATITVDIHPTNLL